MNKRIRNKKRWVIAWVSRLTGYRGRGTAGFRYEVAKEQCAALNRSCPELRHVPAEAGRVVL